MKNNFLVLFCLLLTLASVGCTQKVPSVAVDQQVAVDYYNVGNQYVNKSEWPRAIEAYQKAIDLNPKDSDAYFGLGYAYEGSGEIEKAIDAYKACVNILPKGGAYANLAIIFEKQGKLEDAKANYLKAKEVFQIQQRDEDVKRIDEFIQKLSLNAPGNQNN